MAPLRIAVDVDEVLCPFLKTMSKWKYPGFRAPARHPYHYGKLFRMTSKESKYMVDAFYFSEECHAMEPLEDSQKYLEIMSKQYDLYVMSGRQDIARHMTEEWIGRNYPGVFKDIILTNSFTPHEVDKADLCHSLRMSAIIDDSFETCMKCIDRNVYPIHYIGYPVYPWCNMNPYSEQTWAGVHLNVMENVPI
jgi:hypothetical protein